MLIWLSLYYQAIPRMRNSQGQRINPRTGQSYESYNDHPDTTYPIRPSHEPQPQPWPQHRTRSDPQPTHNQPQPLALIYSQPTPGLEEHFLRSEFMREEVTTSPVTSCGSRRPSMTSEPATPQGPSCDDSSPPVEHPWLPFLWLPNNAGYVLLSVAFW